MFDKLDFIVEKHAELNLQISDPEIISDQKLWQKLMREHADLTPIVEKFTDYKNTKNGIEEAKEIIKEESDEEMRDLAKMELSELEEALPEIEQELKFLLIPKDPNDDKNVILEVRAGAGGDEAGLFAAELLRLYIAMRNVEDGKLK